MCADTETNLKMGETKPRAFVRPVTTLAARKRIEYLQRKNLSSDDRNRDEVYTINDLYRLFFEKKMRDKTKSLGGKN